VRGGDLIRVDYDDKLGRMTFFKEAEDMPPHAMMQMMEMPVLSSRGTLAAGATAETPRAASAKSSRR
jgi:hypothetical protein